MAYGILNLLYIMFTMDESEYDTLSEEFRIFLSQMDLIEKMDKGD